MLYTKEEVLEKLRELKPKYEDEGFIILGIFGSYARNEATESSDIDILYELNVDKFLKKYSGFDAVNRLVDIKKELAEVFGKDVDIADNSSISRVIKKFILEETVYA
jgi:predicted nucleotidyltransferase